MRFFEPWVGPLYWSEGVDGVRLLILGEAHYGTKEVETRDFTQRMVREWGQGERMKFFTMIQQLVQRRDAGYVTDEERRAFWDHVAFYNYIQEFTGEEARIRPTGAMWATAEACYLETLEELKPHVVVALGTDLAAHLPEPRGDIQVLKVQHPSSYGFRVTDWTTRMSEALAGARGRLFSPGQS